MRITVFPTPILYLISVIFVRSGRVMFGILYQKCVETKLKNVVLSNLLCLILTKVATGVSSEKGEAIFNRTREHEKTGLSVYISECVF